MSIKFTDNTLYLKDANGNEFSAAMYGSGANTSMAEIKTYADSQVTSAKTQIDTAKADAEQAITTKATTTIASIPEDYTELTNEVTAISGDLTQLGTITNKDKIPLAYTYGRYVNSDGNWATNDAFGCCIVDVSVYDKILYRKSNKNRYISDIAFSKANNTTTQTYNHFISGNTDFNEVEIPSGYRYLVVNAPVNSSGALGTIDLFGHVSENEKIAVHEYNRTIFPIKTEKNSVGYVNFEGQWATSDNIWMSDFIPIKGITKINITTYVKNPYVSQIVFTKEANYNASMICDYHVLSVGEHDITVPENAKYLLVSSPTNVSGVLGQESVITINTSEFIEYINKKTEVDTIPIPSFNMLRGDTFDISKGCILNKGNHIFRKANSGCKLTDNGFTITSQSNGRKVYELVTFSDNNNELSKKIFNITYVDNAKTDVKVLVIGDSTVYGVGAGDGYETSKMLELFEEKGTNLTLIGTMGSGANKYEGRPGWTIGQYLTKADGNAFIFDGEFDFAMYLSANGFATPDYVVIQLGINDLFNAYNTLDISANNVYANLNTMITKILSLNSNIKVIFNLIIKPTSSNGELWGATYGYTPTPYMSQYAFNYFNKKVIASMQNDRVILCPTNMILDDDDINDTVHPKAKGYDKIAKLLTSVILAS